MPNGYTKADLDSMREVFAPGIEKAKLVASMQIDAAIDLAIEKELGDDNETILALARLIATSWAGLD